MHGRRELLFTTTVLAGSILAACGGDDRHAGPPVSGPSPVPTPTPPTAQYTATPVPFNLAQDRTFDTLGWDSWPSAPTPSEVQFRWNAAIRKYEVLAPGAAEWSRLEALERPHDPTPNQYDVFGSGGTKLPYHLLVSIPPTLHVGNARIFEGSSARAFFAYGIATAPGEVPVSGTMTCWFGLDEIGEGELTFDLAAGTVSGWAEPFWVRGRLQLVQARFARGATTFATTFEPEGVLEGRFFGPGAVNVAVRAKSGGQGFAALTGIMSGMCER